MPEDAIDYEGCAWDLRDTLHDRGSQAELLASLTHIFPQNSYFLSCWHKARSSGCRLSDFLKDLIKKSDDEVLSLARSAKDVALFCYESGEKPAGKMLQRLAQALRLLAEDTEAPDGISLEGLLEGQSGGWEVRGVLTQLLDHFGGSWEEVAKSLSSTGEVAFGRAGARHIIEVPPAAEEPPAAPENQPAVLDKQPVGRASLLERVFSYGAPEQRPLSVDDSWLDVLFSFAKESGPENGEERWRAAVVEDSLSALYPSEYQRGRDTGLPGDIPLLFGLASRRIWPTVHDEGSEPFDRYVFCGRRGLINTIACAERALQDGLRPGEVYRLLEPRRERSLEGDRTAVIARFWALEVIADWMGVNSGTVSTDQLFDDFETLALVVEDAAPTVRLGSPLLLLLTEALLGVLTLRLSGGLVSAIRSLLGWMDEEELNEAGLSGLAEGFSTLLRVLEGTYLYNPETDYSGTVLAWLRYAHFTDDVDLLEGQAHFGQALGDAAGAFAGLCRSLLDAVRGYEGTERAGWTVPLDQASDRLDNLPSQLPVLRDPLSAYDGLPPDLRTVDGAAFAEAVVHLSSGGELDSGRVEGCRELVDRAYTFNVIDERLHSVLGSTLAQIEGAFEGLAEERAAGADMKAVLANCVLSLIERRVGGLVRAFVGRMAERLGQQEHLDGALRERLNEAVEQGDLARIVAYADYEEDNDVLPLPKVDASYEDEFYGLGESSQGVVDVLFRTLDDSNTTSFEQMPFLPDLPKPDDAGRSEAAAVTYQTIAGVVGGIRDKAQGGGLPMDGVPVSLEAARVQLEEVSAAFQKLFETLGFADATVSPFVVDTREGQMVFSWRLRFFSSPSERDSRGELVCPLSEFVVLVDPETPAEQSRVEYEVELYTSYQALKEALLSERNTGLKRLAVYLPPEGALLSPRLRRELMSAWTTPRSSQASGALLLDEVLMAYLASVPNDAWRRDRLAAFFRCALPFTAPLPYGDNVSKSVMANTNTGKSILQPSLFYGRAAILDRIKAQGLTFIYGARRMGKTSILREFVARERAARCNPDGAWHGQTTRVAYRDLYGVMGMSLDNFWVQVVAPGFVDDLPELADVRSAKEVQDILSGASAGWHGQIFYLLIDEVDDLLRFDSAQRGGQRNAIFNSLVDYVQRNAGFHVVMGGLHETMRFADEQAQRNQTYGQIGGPVVVGPLWEEGAYEDAFRLVREPMRSMGYLMRDEDILKMLSRSCYLPNLINIVCEQLLYDMRRRRKPDARADAFFIEVPSAEVDRALRESSGALTDKFQLTIQLDPGYDVLVHALGLLEADSREAGLGHESFSMEEIRDRVIEVGGLGAEGGLSPQEDRLLKELDQDIQELRRFRIIKVLDGRVSLYDGSMCALVGWRQDAAGARLALAAACRRMLDSVREMQGRLDVGATRDIVFDEKFDGLPLFSPLKACDVSRIKGLLSMNGHCVIAAGQLAGSELIRSRFQALLPELCQDGVDFVSGDELPARLEKTATDDCRLVVVSEGWSVDDLRLLRNPLSPCADGRFVLLASPRALWEMRDELLYADDVVAASGWDEDTCLRWARSYAEEFSRNTGGVMRPGAQRVLAERVRDLCGGQAGAMAEVLSGLSGLRSSFALERALRDLSARALSGPDFSWVLDGTCPDADILARAWRRLAVYASGDDDHPLPDALDVDEWLGLLDDGGVQERTDGDVQERELTTALRWMTATCLAETGEKDGKLRISDWFMHALLRKLSCEGGEGR